MQVKSIAELIRAEKNRIKAITDLEELQKRDPEAALSIDLVLEILRGIGKEGGAHV